MIDKDYIKALELLAEQKELTISSMKSRLNFGYVKCAEIYDWLKENEEVYNIWHRQQDGTITVVDDNIGEKIDELVNNKLIVSAEQYYIMGICLYNGIGVKMNKEAGISCFKSASANGYTKAHYVLGLIYESDLYSLNNKDLKKSFDYFMKASDDGSREAQRQIYLCYEQGIGVKPNPTLSDLYYQRSKTQGGKQFIIKIVDEKIVDDDIM